MGNEAGGQAYGAEEAATAQEQPPFIAAQLWALLACSGERRCRCLVEVDVLLSALPQEVPTMPPAHHCSSLNSSSGALPRGCVHLCGPSKSPSENGLESWL